MATQKLSLGSREELIKSFRNRPRHSLYRKDMQIIISTMILDCRASKKLTQKEFAKFMGVSQGMVSKWESCEYNFTVDNIAKICDKLDISPVEIFADDGRGYSFKENKEWGHGKCQKENDSWGIPPKAQQNIVYSPQPEPLANAA